MSDAKEVEQTVNDKHGTPFKVGDVVSVDCQVTIVSQSGQMASLQVITPIGDRAAFNVAGSACVKKATPDG